MIPSHSQSILVLAIVAATSFAAAADEEYYFRFLIKHNSELDQLTHMISIDNVVKDTVYAYANTEQWRALKSSRLVIERLPHPSSLFDHEMQPAHSVLTEWDRYPTYAGYLTMMKQFADSFPTICRLDTIGYSVQCRQLLAVKISDNVGQPEDEPEFFYTSTMHGDETVGYVLTLRLIDYLLHQYGKPTSEGIRVTRLVDNMEIWINPLSNPDGTYRLGGDTTVNNARRYNVNGVDLNRNFPDRINDTVNTTAGRELETQAMMRFVAKHHFALSANFHGGAQVVNYPYDNGTPSGTYSICPDDAWFIALSRIYATPNPDLMSGGFTNGITNGCLWYAVFGGRQDWIYWWYGGRETTIELYNTKNPPGSMLPQRWTNNQESFLAYMEQSLKGIRGIVTDYQSGAPLKARVDVLGIPGVPIYSDSTVGDYHRLLLPGTYALVFSASGYRADTVTGVIVVDSSATRVNVAMHRSSSSVTAERGEIPSQFKLLPNYPNPFNPTTTIRFDIAEPSFVTLKVFNLLGDEIATIVSTNLAAGRYSSEWNASEGGKGSASGVYFCRIAAMPPRGGASRQQWTEVRKLLLLK